ncbi:hypothetical protein JN06_02246 [Bacteroides zoogleoformans]|nr:hypothetical protein JN06_02246 [Bacteroides zoogleoformans]
MSLFANVYKNHEMFVPLKEILIFIEDGSLNSCSEDDRIY